MHTYYSRLFWIDVLRVLAIVLVVLTHSLGIDYPSSPDIVTNLFQTFFIAVVRIAIPLFVMVSGALLLPKTDVALVFYKKRIGKLLYPWVFWSCIYLLWYFWTEERTASSVLLVVKQLYVISMSQFWFLPMIVGLYAITPLLRIIFRNTSQKMVILSILLWIVCFCLVPIVFVLTNHQSSNSPYYIAEHLGYYLLGYLLTIQKRKYSHTILSLLFLLGILFQMLALQMQHLSEFSGNVIDHNTSPFIVLATLSLFLLVKQFFLSKHIWQWGREGITFFATLSFGIFLSHDLVRMILSRGAGKLLLHPPLPYFLSVLWNTVVIFLLSSMFIFFLRWSRVGKYLAT